MPIHQEITFPVAPNRVYDLLTDSTSLLPQPVALRSYELPKDLPKEQDYALAFTPADELLKLSFLSAEAVPNSMVAYVISKRANHLRVQASSISWGKRRARVNSISPGIVSTPLAQHELNSPIGDIYRAMIAASPAKRMASPDEIAVAANYLLASDAGFVTGTDLLIDGGVISARFAGLLPTP